MDIDDWLKFLKFERQTVSGGTVAGRTRAPESTTTVEPRRIIPETTDYANKYERELKNDLRVRFNTRVRHPDEDEHLVDNESIYEKYNFEYRRPNKPLAIAASRDLILDNIHNNTVVVLQGSTGCGKTTQVPQYILDDARARGKYCNIVVAQPRRIAAQTNAQRVCNERGWQIGSIVGYQVGSDQQAHCSEDTRILFCTTGVLLEKLIHAKSLYQYTHIILDEVHERTKEMDFLMVIIYKFLNPSKRVVLMSATIDSATFSNYFNLPSKDHRNRFEAAPIVDIDAKRNYEVKKFFLDHLEAPYKRADPTYCSNISQLLALNQPRVFDEQYQWALKLICLFERLDCREWLLSGKSIEEYQAGPKPTVLVFLPGIHEIMVMYRLLEEWKLLNQETQILRIVLHSTAAPIQAQIAMQQTNRNIRKIILATNIAESSITVPDVKYVIDFCLTRILVTDKETNFSSLRLAWASRNNCEQRAGRTGRVMEGKCFRLVTEEFYTKVMRSSAFPEIINCPLEDIILKIKVLNMGSPESILALAMDKPNLSEIGTTILRLKEMGALLRTTNGVLEEMDGDITFIGRVMASLPIDAKLSKLIVYGYCFSVLNECIVIAAALNCTKNIFKYVSCNGVRPYTQMLEWANGSGSDLFAMLNAFNKWSQMIQQKKFGTDRTKAERDQMAEREKEWADQYNLEVPALRECETYVKDLHLRLKRLQLKALSHEKFKWSDTEKNVILKVVISGAFYPNYFLRSSPNRTQNEREMYNAIDGRDPTKTIFLRGFDNKYLRNIYALTIKQEFVRQGVVDDINKLKVTFDSGAQKVYVTFKTDGKRDDIRDFGVACHPGFVLTEVYKAIRMRQVAKRMIKVPVIDDFAAECSYARRYNLYVDEATRLIRVENVSEYRDICFPRVLDHYVSGSITHIENCDEFYLQPQSEFDQVAQFSAEINRENNDLEPFELPNEIHIGAILAAPYYDTDPRQIEYYRAKVLFNSESDSKDPKFTVQFIDFGNTAICKFKDLRKLSGVSAQYIRIPPRCFRCALAGIQPSILNAPNGIWPKLAIDFFRDLTGDTVQAEVYSTFDGIARVTVRTQDKVNINDLLVEKRFAERCEENYMSKENHLDREKKQQNSQTMQRYQNANHLDDETLRYLREADIPEIKPPSRSGMTEVTLIGPSSPLETQIYPLTSGGQSKSVEIDPHSVNVVLLENEPNDISYKYLVAVSVCQKLESTTDKISVRQTTMMPHIRGFGPLMAAIFCPAMEMVRDKSNSHYCSAISGLGYNEEAGRPLFAENDMTFDLDTEISVHDLEKVNEIRHSMNALLYTEADQMFAINFDDATKSKLMEKIRKLIVELLVKPRHMIAYEATTVKWNQYNPEETTQPAVDDRYSVRAIFPLHKILRLERESVMDLMELQKHNEELRSLARSERPVTRNITCRLCNDPMIETTIALQHHLLSRVHVDRLDAIESTLNSRYAKSKAKK